LNDEGRNQALALVTRLSGAPFSAIYSSPLERARETAEPLAVKTGLHVRETKEIGEIHFGEWTGRSFVELEGDPLWRRYNSVRSAVRIPGGEMAAESQSRVVGCIERLAGLHRGEVLCLFSHGDPIRLLLMHAMGMPLDFIHRLEILPASVSVVQWNESGPRVLRVNDTGLWPAAGARSNPAPTSVDRTGILPPPAAEEGL
jgi:probable phosphoglycerate mutase